MGNFLKGLAKSLYERVFVHYKPTLIGIGLAALVEALNYSITFFQALPQNWAHALASVLLLIFALLKQKVAAPQV